MDAEEAAINLQKGHYFVTTTDDEEIWTYKDGCYVRGGDAQIKAWLESNVKNCSDRFVNETLNKIRRQTYKGKDVFDADPKLVNLKNGLLNLETFNVEPHRPDYLSITQLPVEYEEGDRPCDRRVLASSPVPGRHRRAAGACDTVYGRNTRRRHFGYSSATARMGNRR